MRGKRAEARIPFGALVEIGLISPGTVLYDARARHEAEVRADGSIASAGAQGSIHKIGAHVQGAAACNGWTFWHYEADGTLKPIDALREAARRQARARGLALFSSSAWARTLRITLGSAASCRSRTWTQRQRSGCAAAASFASAETSAK